MVQQASMDVTQYGVWSVACCVVYTVEGLVRLELVRRMYEIAQCCSERLGQFQSSVYIWVLPVVVKLLCDCNGEVHYML